MKKVLFPIIFLFYVGSFAQEWSLLENSPSAGRFDDIFFLDENLGWAADGPGAMVYKTTDGGESWTFQFSDNNYFRNIEFLNENVGFLGTLDSKFYKTTNGGQNWSLVTITPNPEAICGLDAVTENILYGVGAWFTPAYMIKTTDGGQTFDYQDMSAYAAGLVEVLFIDAMHGFASGKGYDGGVILETFDGGVNWTEIFNSGVTGDYVWKLQLRDNNTHIFASIESASQGRLAKSFDSGATWVMKNFPDNDVQGVGFVSDTKGWMGGHNSGFHETNDGGDTWTPLGLGWTLNRFFFLSDDLGYCSGDRIYKFQEVLSVNNFNETSQKDLDVTIAPNPVKDVLQVSINFTHIDHVVMELYDLKGVFIKRLIRDIVPTAGKRSYDFDISAYPAGAYLLDIHTNLGRRSKKFIKE
ncbi:MAG TPA: T9SS type A sorting domain-containing protein [Flavobacteriaceae bacterium]|nr:T9SS type A sorting domain-containing protein [Flavobacteriaceae bacterium]HPF10691.1 T9SS type A sorting domain-containing protein [Flavobacteriaceae bacterium]HQU21964.1 T9SS type A sorting domain-containing protein [Flavobacteriaceae bacterium]HQU64318.1 T9SS type A sorting domain-containing protein [Flavobacteriaceae bacterium]HRW43194.1 T9SS type A sorting domain-containing protein [Flavobacteriaceae bacterium]